MSSEDKPLSPSHAPCLKLLLALNKFLHIFVNKDITIHLADPLNQAPPFFVKDEKPLKLFINNFHGFQACIHCFRLVHIYCLWAHLY